MFEGNNIMRHNSVNGGNKYPLGQALPIQKPVQELAKNCLLNDAFKARKEDHVD